MEDKEIKTFEELYKEIKKLYRDAERERNNAILFEKHGKMCMVVFYDEKFLGYELYERYTNGNPSGGYAQCNHFKRHNKNPQKIYNIIKAIKECEDERRK